MASVVIAGLAAGADTVIQAGLAETGQVLASEQTILAFLAEIKNFRSVAEFGCGHARWLHAARRLGAQEIQGYDSPEMPIEARGLTPEEFCSADVTQFVRLDRKFDLAICFRAPRPADEDATGNLLRTLCESSNWVLFGPGIPYENETTLTNGGWIEGWAKLFLRKGYVCYDILRRKFWHDTRVAFHHRQSTCLYVRWGAHYALKARAYYPSRCPPSLIHPEMFLTVAREMPSPQQDVAKQLRAFYRSGKSSRTEPTRRPETNTVLSGPRKIADPADIRSASDDTPKLGAQHPASV